MATDAVEGWDPHLRGLTVTTLATLMGVVAGISATALAEGPNDNLGVLLLLAAVAVQLPVYKLVGMEVDDFGAKGFLYIAFMTFSLWFITWGILLTAETTL